MLGRAADSREFAGSCVSDPLGRDPAWCQCGQINPQTLLRGKQACMCIPYLLLRQRHMVHRGCSLPWLTANDLSHPIPQVLCANSCNSNMCSRLVVKLRHRRETRQPVEAQAAQRQLRGLQPTPQLDVQRRRNARRQRNPCVAITCSPTTANAEPMPCCQLPGLDHPISQHSHNAVILQQLRGDGPMAEPVWQNARARPRSAARQVLLTRLSRAHARTSSSSVHRAARAMAAQASAGSSERPCSAG